MDYDISHRSIRLAITNDGHDEAVLVIHANAHRTDGPWRIAIPGGRRIVGEYALDKSRH
jgi:hypothetical protein